MNKCNNFITRKTLLYKTGVEYGDYTINHVEGCSHGCKYPCCESNDKEYHIKNGTYAKEKSYAQN